MRLPLALIVVTSAILRLAFAPLTIFAADEIRIFEVAYRFYRTGVIPHEGAAVVYSGTALPGSLLGLLTGLPLYLSGGHPIGAAYSVVAFNLLGLGLTYWVHASLFPKLPRTWLCAFIFFTPWSLLMSSVMNPHFLLPFSAIFMWGVLQQFRKPGDFRASAAVAFALVMLLQLHLSVFALVAVLVVLWGLRLLCLPSPGGTALGAAVGGITLIPFLLQRFTAAEAHRNVLTSNVVIHWDHLLKFPAYFFRLLSFATGDVTRFLVGGTGFFSVGSVLNRLPWLWPLYLAAMAGSGFIVWRSLRFFARSAPLWRKLPPAWRGQKPFRFEEKTDLFVWICVGVTGLLFAFSIKGPSAHTYWILFPVALYPFLKSVEDLAHLSPARRRTVRTALAVYLVSAITVAFVGYGFAVELQRIRDYRLSPSQLANP